MNANSAVCPKCGATTVGKFCSECGEKIRGSCPSCGTELPAKAHYCSQCGASVDARASSRSTPASPARLSKEALPWIAVAGIGLILAGAAAVKMLARESSPPPAVSATTPSSPPDLSTMSPAEAAERLFNRVMAAYENGDIAQAQQFAPMALDAYAQLGPLDNDGHYHVGLIHITLGDTQSAQAELEAIQSSVPEHLLGLMLEHSIAEANEDAEETTRVYTSFLAAYDDEISVGRDEYLGHRNGIDGFRARAFDAVAEP